MTDYPVKAMMRSQGLYPKKGMTEEQTNFSCALLLMEMLMRGKETMHTREGDKLPLEEAAEIAADCWGADKDEMIASWRRWDAMTPEERASQGY